MLKCKGGHIHKPPYGIEHIDHHGLMEVHAMIFFKTRYTLMNGVFDTTDVVKEGVNSMLLWDRKIRRGASIRLRLVTGGRGGMHVVLACAVSEQRSRAPFIVPRVLWSCVALHKLCHCS
jgi:hypothetical protein